MGDVVNFKCPCCAAPLSFSGTTGEMTCKYCDSSFTMEQVKAAEAAEKESAQASEMTWSSTEQALIQDENGKVAGYICPSCGAQMVADEHTAATECPYCGNPAVIPQSFEGMYRPDLMIPFAVDKEQAKAKLTEFTRGKKLLPKAFTANNRIQEITGLYVPFWLYSCHADGYVAYEGVKSKTWEDENFVYTKKDHYHLTRQGEMDFAQIPVDASSQMDDATMDSLEPYDLSKAVSYDAAYFSGYLANRYDVEEKDAQPRANDRVLNTFRSKMREQVRDYEEVVRKGESIRLSGAKAEYAMLPVWMMTTKYQGENYTFAINGQTGKMTGRLPIDQGLYYKYLALGALIPLLLMQVVLYFMGNGRISRPGEIVALILSVVIGLIYSSHLKSGMNTVAAKHNAAGYVRENSVRSGRPGDTFLFTKTERREKPKTQTQAPSARS